MSHLQEPCLSRRRPGLAAVDDDGRGDLDFDRNSDDADPAGEPGPDPADFDDDWDAGPLPDADPPWEDWDPADDEPAEPEPGDFFWPDSPAWDE